MPSAGGRVQEVLEGNRRGDGCGEQQDHSPPAGFYPDGFPAALGHGLWNREIHQGRGHEIVDRRRDEENEELLETDFAFLPNHQRRDIAERRERSAGIGGDHHADAAEREESRRISPQGDHDRADDKRRRQIVEERRQEERDNAGDPEKLPVAQAPSEQPRAQSVKKAALLHRVDIGHRHDDEEKNFREFFNDALGQFVWELGSIRARNAKGDKRPDQPGRYDDRLRFP